ncbi:aromatic prenyltransferase [Crucibulum laeve]|uniref:Aromatic prenyltransferase n=1 Tax=Crucibulum laeve TaxID=68775 RepID=A0A5C3LLL1_9AGAR|nr:aromatic prenyltransferase [Crucibulum laeve]
MGPTPSEFITTGPCSFLSDDHTPAELIWVVDGDGRMSIRYSMEPLSPHSGVPSSSNVWRPTLDAFYNFPRIAGVDLSWSDICRETLTYDSDPDSETRESASQFFLGGDFGSKGVLGKVYFLPHYRAKVMNVSEESLVQDCMTALGVGSPCDRLFAFTESLPKDKRPSIAMVAVDCLEPSKNRAKVYFRTHVSTFNDIKDLLTLGGSLSGPIIIDTLAILHRLWELFFPGVAADESLVPTFPERFQPGFMIYFEMILGQQTLHPKVYIPVRQYCKSDAQIGSAISKYYEGINDDFSQRYISDLANLFPHRPLAARTGIHTYVGCCSRKTGPQLSFYLSPECFAPERT